MVLGSSDRVETLPVARIRVASEQYFARAFGKRFDKKRQTSGRRWAKAKLQVVVGFDEDELADPPFIEVAAASEGAYLLVPHARDRRGESPIVRHYSDEGTTDLSLAGRSFDAWVSARVDELITELTLQFGG